MTNVEMVWAFVRTGNSNRPIRRSFPLDFAQGKDEGFIRRRLFSGVEQVFDCGAAGCVGFALAGAFFCGHLA